MTPQEIFMLQTYGPWFLVLVLVLRELLPFLRDRLFPAYLNRQEREAAKRNMLDERQIQSYESIAKAMTQLTVLFGTINDRTELTAVSAQRIERTVSEINVRSKMQENNPDTRRRSVTKNKKSSES